jgi:hypothetical protein
MPARTQHVFSPGSGVVDWHVHHEERKGGEHMTSFDPSTRIYQSQDPNVVYSTPDNQQVHILYGGQGTPAGPGHGHYIYNPVQDRVVLDRPPS